MDDSDEIISIWKNVSIEINANNLAPGTLKMIRCGTSIIFHWIPEHTTNSDLFDINPANISFAIDLYHVNSISFDLSHIKYGKIDFLFKDFSVFPRIVFTNYGTLAVFHLVQFLLNQKIATVSPHNESMVSISSNISETHSLPENAVNSSNFKIFVDHWKVLDQLGVHESKTQKNPVTEDTLKNIKKDDDEDSLFLKNLCFENGISDNDRCKIWPFFLLNGIQYHMEDPENLTKHQNDEISSTINSIFNDTTILTKSEKHSESYLLFLRDILCAISFFYPNTTFHNYLCEILSIFIDIFVKSFQGEKNKVIMEDGRILEYNEARYFIFVLFINFINKNANFQVLIQSHTFYHSFVDRINAIVEFIDPSTSNLLSLYQMSKNLNFLSQSIYLIYSHDFNREKLFRLWDSIVTFSDEKDSIFILFFHAAMVIFLFNPMFMLHKNIPVDIFQAADEAKKKADLEIVIKMATNLLKIVKENKNMEWVFQPLDEENDYIDYKSTYLTIISE